jgi:hypothetical protein
VFATLGAWVDEEARGRLADARPSFEMAYMICPARVRLVVHLLVVMSFLAAASLLFLYPLLLSSLW